MEVDCEGRDVRPLTLNCDLSASFPYKTGKIRPARAGAPDGPVRRAVSWVSGRPPARRTLPLDELSQTLYAEIRHVAAGQLRREHALRSISPTDLAHEAMARAIRSASLEEIPRAEILRRVARLCRQVLVDRARARLRLRRGSGERPLTLEVEPEADTGTGTLDVLAVDASNFAILSRPAGYDCDFDDGVSQLAGHSDVFGENVSGQVNLSPREELDTLLSRVQVDWDINDSMTLTSVTSYFELEEDGASCYGYDLNGIGCNHTINETDAFAQELRLAGDINDNVSFLLGAFYQDRELIFDTGQEAVGGAQIAAVLGLPTADPTTGFTDDWRKIHTTDSETWSVFGSVTFRPTDRLEVTAGLRYSEEERTNDIQVDSVHYIFGVIGFPTVPAGFNSGDIEFDDDNISPEVSVLYALNDNVNLFAAYKSGYKSGGIDNSALPSASLAAAAASGDFAELIYETEEGDGFEVGLKGRFNDGTLRLDVTAFRYVYEDLQVQSFNASTVQFSTSNAGELISQGLELDFTWLPDVDGLSIYGAVSFLDAEFSDSFIPEPPAGITDPAIIAQYDLDGRAVSQAADYAFNVGMDYESNLADTGLIWGLGLNTSYSDEYETQNEDPIGFIQDSHWLLNARIFVGADDGRWTLSLMGNNLTDELVVTTSGGRPFADTSNNTLLPGGVGLSDTVLNYNRGRQLFAQFEVRL